jgi:glycosyltransferase involved in cell wall biosynthesis
MRILVDGRNLSLQAGTGIATYTRNVCSIAKQAGHSVDVLYGEPLSTHRQTVLREIGFFDAQREKASWLNLLRRDLRAVTSNLRPVQAFEIPLSGTVVARQFGSRLPIADRLWNATNLFYNAHVAYGFPYRLSNGFTRVTNVFSSDIAHWTSPMPLRLQGASNVYTLHDLVPLRLPFTTLDRKRIFYRMIERICRDADAILTVSETSRNDIISLFDVPGDKVINTYQSVDIPAHFLNVDQTVLEEELRGLHDVTYKGYILFYGAIEPKKNVGRLIEAFLASNIDIPLLIVGKDGWLQESELALLQSEASGDTAGEDRSRRRTRSGAARGERPRKRIRRINYVSFPQLVNLVRGARLVAFPSLYEGFGLPIVEAMTCGTPVLTSNIGATAEIAGDAALLVDPYDVRDIKNGLIRLATDTELAASLIAKGRQRVEAFSQECYAARLAEAYDRVAARRA